MADVGANDNDQRLIVSFGANKHSDFFNGGRRGKRLTTRVFVSDNFQRHAEGSVKDAAAFCPGILRDETARKPDDGVVNRFQENVVALGVLAYDVDGAQTYADAIANLGGVKFLGYSSYSHLKQPGVEKFRIVIFLTVPIVATTGEMTRVVESVGDHYGIKFDRSKRTPKSLFYLPRHDGSEASRRNAFIDLAHLNGAPFDPTPFIEAAKGAVAVESAGREEKRAEREVRKAAQEAARQATAKKYTTPWLADFIGRLGDVFDMPGCVAACVDAAKDRSPVTLPCPNEQHHTGRGDGRHTCFVYAKGDPDGEGGLRETPGAFCNHGTCKATLKPWDMFDLICAKHGIELTHALDYVPAEARKVYEASAGLPLGFEVRDGAIWTWSDKKYVRVCDVFEIVGRVCDERDGQWGTEIRFQNGKGNSCSVVVNNAELHDGDKALRARLAGAGLKIETGAPLHFLRLMNGLHAERIVTAVTKPGWYGLGTSEPIYVTVRGDVLGATDPESWRLAESGGAKDRDAKGSLEGWKRSIVGAVESTLNWAPHHAWGLMTGTRGSAARPYGPIVVFILLFGRDLQRQKYDPDY